MNNEGQVGNVCCGLGNDERSVLDEVFKAYPEAGRESLIPILQEIQLKYGYLSREAMIEVGRYLGLPVSKVYGVATFYNQFRFHPIGKYHIQVCRGTACHVKGSDKVLDALKQILGIEPGQTSGDGLFSLEVVACLGACGLSPVVTVNGEFYAGVSPKDMEEIVCRIKKQEEQNDGEI